MATVKISGGKVVTKGGRVSCSCCVEEIQCCIFDATTASAGNLPESINFYGDTLSLSGTSYGDTTNGVALEGGVWAVYKDGSRRETDCIGLGYDTIPSRPVSAIMQSAYLVSFDLRFPDDSVQHYESAVTFAGTVTSWGITECAWLGPGLELGVSLYRLGGIWVVNFGEVDRFGEKTESQGDPVGAYTSVVSNVENISVS
jgi:hypothetical protein